MASGLSPTQRGLAALRDRGMVAEVVQKWNQYAGPFGRRKDLFGFVDVLALDPSRPGEGFLGVQACAGGDLARHLEKIRTECRENAEAWLRAGGRIEVWAWRKVKLRRGGKAMRWAPRVVEVTQEVLADPCGGALAAQGGPRTHDRQSGSGLSKPDADRPAPGASSASGGPARDIPGAAGGQR